MSDTTNPPPSHEAVDIWNRIAPFWDDFMGDEGNDFHRLLVAPSAERLLGLQPGEWVVEVACGAGLFARQMARQGAHVVACDGSHVFIERARARAGAVAGQLAFHVVDATDEAQLRTLGERRFDAAVCNMALMDIADIAPLLRALSRMLKPGGRFVFTTMHPVLNHMGTSHMVEEEDVEGAIVTRFVLKVHSYITPRTNRGLGIVGQPVAHYYFHRPLHLLLNTCFDAGFVLDRLEEPTFPPDKPGKRLLSWENFKEIPPVLAARLRLPK